MQIVDVTRGLNTAGILPRGRRASGRDAAPEGNEEKWFRSKEVQRFETGETPKSRSDAAQKNFNPSGEIGLSRMPIYIGAFFPACAWYPR